MKNDVVCPVCGALLGSEAPEDLCPACLLGAGLGGGQEAEEGGLGTVDMIAEKPGDTVGRYHLVEKIGEGGFGVVFRAEQRKPVRWVVAVKIIKPGMDSKEVVTRFQAERQALALMDHPNIAKVYDAGMTEWGRPYFVMEYVEGRPLTKYCDEQGLDIRERLELFIRICRGVQHAHQKGVIHRDLKPSNILVTEGDEGVARPKIIDFGVAKAISIELTEKTFFTMFGRVVGTPLYMSPEQTELNAVDVDTRSDIYALGVVLYELVTGRAPIGEQALHSASFDEMRRMIREEEPLKPSACVVNLPDDARQAAAKTRRIDPAKFRRRLSGDLDWIVMKALEKDRNRRYGTAHSLAVDVRRHLRGLPVVAGPPGAAYRVGKFVRRHRAGVGVTIFVVLALLGGTLWSNFLIRGQGIETEFARNKTEFARLELLVQGVKDRRKEDVGSREEALAALDEVGHYELDKIAVQGATARKLRDDARNELIACLAWTDLHREPLADGRSEEEWVPVALDGAHDRCVLGFADGRLEVREASGDGGDVVRPGKGIPVRGPLQFDPKGDLVAAGFGKTDEWALVIWNWRSGEEVAGVAGVHAAFDFHPDGKGFAVGTPAGTLDIRARDGTASGKPIALPGKPVALRFHPDGHQIAVATEQDGVVVIDIATGDQVEGWDDFTATSLAWSPDGRSIVAGGADGAVTVRELGRPKPAFRVMEHSEQVDQVTWSSDGRLIASAGRDDKICLWDGHQGELLCMYSAAVGTLNFSDDAGLLGPVFSRSRVVSTLEVQRSRVCHRAAGHPGEKVLAAVWSQDCTVLATAGKDGLRLWNWAGAQLAHIPDVRVRPGGMACSTTHLYLATESGIVRRSLSSAAGRLQLGPVETLSQISDAGQIVLSPPGAPGAPYLAVARDREVVLLDLASGESRHRLKSLPSTAFLAVSPDGNWLAAGTSDSTGVRVWPLAPSIGSHEDLAVDGAATVAFYPLAVDPRTKAAIRPRLMTGDATAYRLWTWDGGKAKWVKEAPDHPSEMSNRRGRMAKMVFSPRGTAVVISYDYKHLQILNPKNMRLMTQPGFEEQWPLAVSPDGRMMTTEAANGRLAIWDLAKNRKELAIRGLDWPELRLRPFHPVPVPLIAP
jgi:WD40 repeat protein/predicted Ser/Thr protein kinase